MCDYGVGVCPLVIQNAHALVVPRSILRMRSTQVLQLLLQAADLLLIAYALSCSTQHHATVPCVPADSSSSRCVTSLRTTCESQAVQLPHTCLVLSRGTHSVMHGQRASQADWYCRAYHDIVESL